MTLLTAGRSVRVLTRAAALSFSLVFGMGAAATAHAEPAYAAYLDLPSVNGDGAGAGGLNPLLPLNEAALAEAVRQARSDSVEPRRYATLLHQYWLVSATRNADIDLATWDPGRGPRANERVFNQVYVNYLRLATRHPEFYWAGLAGIAGGSFASGFFDMSDAAVVLDVPGIRELGAAVADLLRATPPELARALPPDIHLLATEGSRLSAADVAWYQTRLMIMQKHIFTDLVPMHEAYVALGMRGIEEMYAAGLLDDDIRAAWQSIAAGTREGYVDALVRMTDREQNHVVADQWDETAAGRAPIGRVLTYVSTVAGKPAVPGVRAPGVFAPAVVTAEVGGRSLALRVPLPGFNWADRASRWDYIAGDLVPRHIDLETDPVLAAAVLGEAFWGKLARGRLAARLPDLLADLSAHWQVTG
ncbi:hypothetical protein [Nocardia asiatica]|uniref:hypothetical protein n=1 Tax=Nocardia asiatica TaxID=209252 RepID=UPI00245465E3|nr:hypothetical protein [Nocardia asiatica]